MVKRAVWAETLLNSVVSLSLCLFALRLSGFTQRQRFVPDPSDSDVGHVGHRRSSPSVPPRGAAPAGVPQGEVKHVKASEWINLILISSVWHHFLSVTLPGLGCRSTARTTRRSWRSCRSVRTRTTAPWSSPSLRWKWFSIKSGNIENSQHKLWRLSFPSGTFLTVSWASAGKTQKDESLSWKQNSYETWNQSQRLQRQRFQRVKPLFPLTAGPSVPCLHDSQGLLHHGCLGAQLWGRGGWWRVSVELSEESQSVVIDLNPAQ